MSYSRSKAAERRHVQNGRASLALLAAGLLGVTTLASCSDSGSGQSEETAAVADSDPRGDGGQSLRMAVTDLQGLEELQREFGAFVGTFEEISGIELEFFAVNDRVAAGAALSADRVDVVFTGPAEYVVLNARTEVEPIIGIRRPEYRSCIYTTVDSGIEDVADLQGSKIAMSDVGSTSGHLGPSQLIVDGGLDPLDDLQVVNVGDAVHETLKRGDVDAVGDACHNYDTYMESDNPENYKVVIEGEPLPPDVLVAHPGVNPELVERVRTTFVEHSDELLTAMMDGEDNATRYGNAEIVDVDDADYDIVRSMYEAIGVDDFTEFVGD